jgi:GTP cyclohydrolase I
VKDTANAERNKAFITEYIEAMNGNEKTEELMNKYIDESCTELRQHIKENDEKMYNFELNVKNITAHDDIVVVQGNVMGLRKSDMKPIMGSVQLNYQINDGKIVKFWMGN